MTASLHRAALAFAAGLAVAVNLPASAAPAPPPPPLAASYADLADLADSAPIVARAQVRKLIKLKPERAQGVAPGFGRYYVEAQTEALLTGNAPLGGSLRYLVDVPLDARGKAPAIKKRSVLIFARPVPGRPGELQLVQPNSQLLWNPQLESSLRAILTAMAAPDAPDRVTGVREAIHVPGTLAGEGETQIFLATEDNSAASITVQHRPGTPPAWGASFSELIADVGNPPRPGTLAWYRLACFLPDRLPESSNLSASASSRAQAEADYRMVLGELGPCSRSR